MAKGGLEGGAELSGVEEAANVRLGEMGAGKVSVGHSMSVIRSRSFDRLGSGLDSTECEARTITGEMGNQFAETGV